MAGGCYRTENPGVCGCVGLAAVGVKRASPFRDLKKGQQTTQGLARGIGPKKGAAPSSRIPGSTTVSHSASAASR